MILSMPWSRSDGYWGPNRCYRNFTDGDATIQIGLHKYVHASAMTAPTWRNKQRTVSTNTWVFAGNRQPNKRRSIKVVWSTLCCAKVPFTDTKQNVSDGGRSSSWVIHEWKHQYEGTKNAYWTSLDHTHEDTYLCTCCCDPCNEWFEMQMETSGSSRWDSKHRSRSSWMHSAYTRTDPEITKSVVWWTSHWKVWHSSEPGNAKSRYHRCFSLPNRWIKTSRDIADANEFLYRWYRTRRRGRISKCLEAVKVREKGEAVINSESKLQVWSGKVTKPSPACWVSMNMNRSGQLLKIVLQHPWLLLLHICQRSFASDNSVDVDKLVRSIVIRHSAKLIVIGDGRSLVFSYVVCSSGTDCVSAGLLAFVDGPSLHEWRLPGFYTYSASHPPFVNSSR